MAKAKNVVQYVHDFGPAELAKLGLCVLRHEAADGNVSLASAAHALVECFLSELAEEASKGSPSTSSEG